MNGNISRKMRKTIFKWLILTTLFAYVTAVTIWAHGEARRHACQGIEVKIASANSVDSVTINGVKEELSKFPKKIEGTAIERINTREIENYLSLYSNFENVECALTTNGILSVSVVPMIPEIRVFEPDKSYYINKDGKRIESKANFFVDVPVVSGNFSETFPAKNILPVTRFIQNDPVLRQLVGMVEARNPDNIMLVPRIHGHVVNFGDTSRLGEKRNALLTFYRKVIPYKGWEEYDTISVKFKGQIVATRRNKTANAHGTEFEEEIDLEEATLPSEAFSREQTNGTTP